MVQVGNRAALLRYLDSHAPAYGVDPQAALAVASAEGLGGGVGDEGTSFGPWQLHEGGAYPSTAPHGSASQANSWAWSSAGIDYALREMGQVAANLKGDPAIVQIVQRFERPQDPSAEIARAEAYYSSAGRLPAVAGGANGAPATTASGASVTQATTQTVGFSLASPEGSTEALAIRAGLFLVGTALLVLALVLLSKAITGRKLDVVAAGAGFLAGRETKRRPPPQPRPRPRPRRVVHDVSERGERRRRLRERAVRARPSDEIPF